MNILIGTIMLCVGAWWLWRKLPDDDTRRQALQASIELSKFTLPRITMALIGAALFAELLPADRIEGLFGAEAGLTGIALAVLIGPLVPGGPFVAFAIGAAGMQVGASDAALMAFIASWGLFSLTKAVGYEIPLIGGRFALTRLLASLPLPFLLAFFARVLL